MKYKWIRIIFLGVLAGNSFAFNITIPKLFKNKLSIDITTISGAPIYTYHANKPSLIASNAKLFTTDVALHYLNPDFHWHTKLLYSGNIKGGILYGNIYVVGGGDPLLASNDIYSLLSTLKRNGVHKIEGKVVLDETIFNTYPTYSMLEVLPYDVDTIIPHGIMINQNITKIEVKQQNHQIKLKYNLFGYKVDNKLQINQTELICSNLDRKIKFTINRKHITVSGSIPQTCLSKKLELYLLPNFDYNTMVIGQTMHDLDIKVTDGFLSAMTPKSAVLLSDHQSPSLEEYLIIMNRFSNNLVAETLLMSLGAYRTSNANTYAQAVALYDGYLKEHKLVSNGYSVENGAGLTRHAHYTTHNIVTLLQQMQHSPLQSDFEASLPMPGFEGTLSESPIGLTGNAHIKTGTLNDVRSYSGYVYTNNGHKYIVSIVANGVNTNDTNEMNLLDGFIRRILKRLN